MNIIPPFAPVTEFVINLLLVKVLPVHWVKDAIEFWSVAMLLVKVDPTSVNWEYCIDVNTPSDVAEFEVKVELWIVTIQLVLK